MRFILGIIVSALVVAAGIVLVTGNPAGDGWSATPMTFGEYSAQLAYSGDEDTDGWDCRINGNAQCGDVQYELICLTRNPTPDTVCRLEGSPVSANH